MVKLIEDVLGDEAKNMINVRLLCVSPDKQGLGYGSALLNAIIFMVRFLQYPCLQILEVYDNAGRLERTIDILVLKRCR